jgi:hypothetical protein
LRNRSRVRGRAATVARMNRENTWVTPDAKWVRRGAPGACVSGMGVFNRGGYWPQAQRVISRQLSKPGPRTGRARARPAAPSRPVDGWPAAVGAATVTRGACEGGWPFAQDHRSYLAASGRSRSAVCSLRTRSAGELRPCRARVLRLDSGDVWLICHARVPDTRLNAAVLSSCESQHAGAAEGCARRRCAAGVGTTPAGRRAAAASFSFPPILVADRGYPFSSSFGKIDPWSIRANPSKARIIQPTGVSSSRGFQTTRHAVSIFRN